MDPTPSSQDLGTTSSGLTPKVAAALAYVFGFASGLLIFLTEKKNVFVRFHALQAVALSVVWALLSLGAPFVPLVGPIVNGLVNLAGLILWIFVIVKAAQGQWYRIPKLGDFVAKQLGVEIPPA